MNTKINLLFIIQSYIKMTKIPPSYVLSLSTIFLLALFNPPGLSLHVSHYHFGDDEDEVDGENCHLLIFLFNHI